MHRLLALALAVPLSTFAQASAPAPATEPGLWSLGAGLSTGTVYVSRSAGSGLVPLSFLGTAANASLERRVGERSWLVLGVAGNVYGYDADVPAGVSGTSRQGLRGLQAESGLRRALTPTGAPVDVSLLATAQLGYSWSEYRTVSAATSSTQGSQSWTAGASVGLAVDRELTPGLSLRVATPLASLTWGKLRITQTGTAAVEGSEFWLGVAIAPRLELRLAF